MKTIIDESILTNPVEKALVEKATKTLEAELDESARRVRAEWRRLPSIGEGTARFDLTLTAWDESISQEYDSRALLDEEKLAQLYYYHWRRVTKKVMRDLVERAEARVAALDREKELHVSQD